MDSAQVAEDRGDIVPFRAGRPRDGRASRTQAREDVYRDLLNALPTAIYTTDAEGRITFYNAAARELAGREPTLGVDEWCVTWRLFNADGSRLPHDECPMATALKEGRAVRGVEAIAERPDGSRLWFMPFPTPLRDDAGVLVGAVNMLVDITERKRSEESQTLLTNEVNHRANNLLTIVQAALRLTEADTVEDFREAMEGRIGALAHAHNLLAKSRWTEVDLGRLVTDELAPYMGAAEPRVWISGPAVALTPQQGQSLAMAIHELATNAAKYGALSGAEGRVMVEWRDAGGALRLRWRELGGPPAPKPLRDGVGGKVIRAALAQLGGEACMDWRPEGLVCEIELAGRPAA